MQRTESLFSRVIFWILAAALSLMFVYETFASVTRWIGMSDFATAVADGLSLRGTLWLLAGVLIPVGIFAGAIIAGRKRGSFQRILMLILGISLVAVLQMDIMGRIPTTHYLG